MGRPPLPDNVHQLRGTTSQVNRGKPTAGVSPDPAHLQDLTPPEHLPESAKAVWREFAERLSRNHVLTELDTFAFEKLCVSIARYRKLTADTEERLIAQNPETGTQSIAPRVTLQQMYANQADTAMSKFGMTPSDRAKVLVQPQGDLFGNDNPAGNAAARHFT